MKSQDAEKLVATSAHLASCVDDLVWPRFPWIREVLIGLGECEWEYCPRDLAVELRSCFTRHGTKTVEDMINFVRSETRKIRLALSAPFASGTAWWMGACCTTKM